jgi:nitrogen fixation/metabolism regulation signal transduction histidine kinase
MTDEAAMIVWLALAGWLALGLVIGLGVILFGLKRLTPAAHMKLRVRLLILPGLAALWPVVLLRLAGVRAPEDKA